MNSMDGIENKSFFWMEKLSWTYFVGDFKHNTVNYDFFSSLLLETSSLRSQSFRYVFVGELVCCSTVKLIIDQNIH